MARIAVHQTQRLTDLTVPKCPEPSAFVLWLIRQPGADGLNENEVRQPRNHDLRTGSRVARLVDQLTQRTVKPPGRLIPSVANMNQSGQEHNEMIVEAVLKFEQTAHQVRFR